MKMSFPQLCRDRFIFGSCCKLPEPEVEAVVAESESNELWEEEVNNLPLDQVTQISLGENNHFNGLGVRKKT